MTVKKNILQFLIKITQPLVICPMAQMYWQFLPSYPIHLNGIFSFVFGLLLGFLLLLLLLSFQLQFNFLCRIVPSTIGGQFMSHTGCGSSSSSFRREVIFFYFSFTKILERKIERESKKWWNKKICAFILG